MVYCSNCGKEIADDSTFCQFCGASVDGNSNVVSNNVNNLNNMNNYGFNGVNTVNKYALKVMSSSRLFLYYSFTLGLYPIYWIYKNNKMLKEAFNKDVNATLRTIGLFIPIANWIVYYFTLRDIKDLLIERNLDTFSLGANFIFMAILPILGLNVFSFLNVQEYINDLCIYENPEIKINRKYTGTELALLVIAGIIWIVFIVILFSFIFYSLSYGMYY